MKSIGDVINRSILAIGKSNHIDYNPFVVFKGASVKIGRGIDCANPNKHGISIL
jgi:hypothetical protein